MHCNEEAITCKSKLRDKIYTKNFFLALFLSFYFESVLTTQIGMKCERLKSKQAMHLILDSKTVGKRKRLRNMNAA